MSSRDARARVPTRRQRPCRGLRVRLTSLSAHNSTFAFSVRLCLAIAATFAALGTTAYVLVGDQLHHRLLDTYAAEHRADGRSFANVELRARSSFGAHHEIGELLGGIGQRPGVTEAVLVGAGDVVEAAGDPAAVGRRSSDPRVRSVLRGGPPYVGRAANGTADERDFEFVVAGGLSGGRPPLPGVRKHQLLHTPPRDGRPTATPLLVARLIRAPPRFYPLRRPPP